MLNFSHWQASANEHRIAWIVACCSIATIFLASVWPELFNLKPISPAPESVQVEGSPSAQQEPRFTTPTKEPSRIINKQTQNKSDTNREKTVAVVKKIKPVINKSPPQKTTKTKPGKGTVVSGSYYVQTGAFKEKALAQKLVGKMKKHGWDAVIVPKSGLHAVWVGPKNSRDGIEGLQKSINNTLKIKGFIVQKRSL